MKLPKSSGVPPPISAPKSTMRFWNSGDFIASEIKRYEGIVKASGARIE